jgi:hypothetical protein
VINLDDTGPVYNNGVIAIWAAATFKHFKVVANNSPATLFGMAPYNNPTTLINYAGGFHVSDITYVGGPGAGYFALISAGITSGLIDNCRITGGAGNAELIFARGPTDAWQTNNTLGGANNIFIEDCTIAGSGYVCDANSNSRLVVRNNTVTGNIKVDGHGVASNSPARSYRNMEVYSNYWTSTIDAWPAIELRGGVNMVFNNKTDYAGTNGAWFFLTDYGYLDAWPNFAYVLQVPPDFYPATDQIGVGKDPKVAGSEPTYVWGNKRNGSVWPRTYKSNGDYTIQTDGAGYPIGSTTIHTTALPLDYYPFNGIAIAGDSHRYYIVSTALSGSTSITIQSPGL